MIWTEAEALLLIERCIALAVLLQTLELWLIRERLSDTGIWRWPLLRAEHRSLPSVLRRMFARVLPYDAFRVLLAVRAIAAFVMLGAGGVWLAPVLLLSQVAICVRFRGTFNGGSDYMSVAILLALSFAWTANLARAALAYVAVQATLSYCIAGLVKLRHPAWRDGSALAGFLEVARERHGAPAWLARALGTPFRSRLLARCLIAFECGFPLAWLDPRICLVLLAAGLCFHLGNSVVFGLNRFFFAWAAAYPALYYCSQLLGASSA